MIATLVNSLVLGTVVVVIRLAVPAITRRILARDAARLAAAFDRARQAAARPGPVERNR
jgi:hypothetical protein